jgi:hypothetical protein
MRPRSPGRSMPCSAIRSTGSRCGIIRDDRAASRIRAQSRKPKLVFIEGPLRSNRPHPVRDRREDRAAGGDLFLLPRRRQRPRPERHRQPGGGHPGALRRLVSAHRVFAGIRGDEDGRRARSRSGVHRSAASCPGEASRGTDGKPPTTAPAERRPLITTSGFYQQLAGPPASSRGTRRGTPSSRIRRRGPEAFRREMATFCCAAAHDLRRGNRRGPGKSSANGTSSRSFARRWPRR